MEATLGGHGNFTRKRQSDSLNKSKKKLTLSYGVDEEGVVADDDDG